MCGHQFLFFQKTNEEKEELNEKKSKNKANKSKTEQDQDEDKNAEDSEDGDMEKDEADEEEDEREEDEVNDKIEEIKKTKRKPNEDDESDIDSSRYGFIRNLSSLNKQDIKLAVFWNACWQLEFDIILLLQTQSRNSFYPSCCRSQNKYKLTMLSFS